MATMPRSNPEARFDITIAGETNLDLILYGLPEDMPIERELLASGFETTLGGSSSILAHNLARLGSKVGFVTQLGRDDLGSIALQRLRDAGVDISRVTYCDDKATGVTLLLPSSWRPSTHTDLPGRYRPDEHSRPRRWVSILLSPLSHFFALSADWVATGAA